MSPTPSDQVTTNLPEPRDASLTPVCSLERSEIRNGPEIAVDKSLYE